jgi:hypothetical protein
MPVKKSRTTSVKTDSAHKAASSGPGQNTGAALIIFILFISLAIVSLALYRVHEKQERLIGIINHMSNRGSQAVAMPEQSSSERKMQYRDADVSNLRLAYTPCPATFTGPCDDLMVYRLNESGTKEVLIPSTRAIGGAPLTSELLHPFAVNHDFSRMAFGAWAYGGKRNSDDKRVWIVESKTGRVLAESNNLLTGSVFSPNMLFAAYYLEDEKGVGQIMLANIVQESESLIAREAAGIFFKNENGSVSINWLNDKTIAVIQYELTESGELRISGEREITIN